MPSLNARSQAIGHPAGAPERKTSSPTAKASGEPSVLKLVTAPALVTSDGVPEVTVKEPVARKASRSKPVAPQTRSRWLGPNGEMLLILGITITLGGALAVWDAVSGAKQRMPAPQTKPAHASGSSLAGVAPGSTGSTSGR